MEYEISIQQSLEHIAEGYLDTSAWWIIIKMYSGIEVARIGSVIQIDSLATLISVIHPTLYVYITKYGLNRKVYSNGVVIKEQIDLKEILPDATAKMIEDWEILK